MDNTKLEIWKQISTTPPHVTKQVAYGGRKFHSIDSQWQLEQMTKVFGPCGAGWGYETESTEVTIGNYVLAKVSLILWFLVEDKRAEFGPVTGSCELARPRTDKDKLPLYDQSGKIVHFVDTDAYKKAETDALTKAMSRIGMSADVFMGRHDDNKYVAYVKEILQGGDPAFQRLKTAALNPDIKPAHANRILTDIRTLHSDGLVTDDQYEEITSILT